MRGQLITFEGLDGSGKSTHLRRAAAWLRERGLDVVETQEPGGTPLGAAIRGIFLDPQWGSMDGVVELLLVAASRRQHLLEVVEPALAAGRWVLCDRFSDSTVAYQGWGRGVATEAVRTANELATRGLRPDLTLLFDLAPEEARARGHSPTRRSAGDVDRLDAEELSFYQRVREGFRTLAAEDEGRFRVIDSSGPRDSTAAAVVDVLAQALEAHQ